MVLPMLSAGKAVGSTPGLEFKTCAQNEKNSRELSFEELKITENRVEWFLAELCKAEKGVQKDKRNQRRTELVTELV